MKLPKVLDNKKNKVVDELKSELKKGSKLSVISAYFTIYAYAELKKELNKIENMRFIFTEPTFVKKDRELTREFYIEHNNEKKILGNEFEIKLRNEMNQAIIAKECAAWISEKVEIKSLKQYNPAQLRLIYIESNDNSLSINGTVDFTSDGLGITPSNRLDSNMCMYGKEYNIGFLQAFNELWTDESAVEDVKEKVLHQMQIIYKENTPEFIYFVTLYNIFKNYLEELTEDNILKTKTGFKDTEIWDKLYKFQKDGVMGAIDKLEKYNGCIIADSVGLGKTFSALAIIKYYELRNDRVLVLTPKKLRENWTIYTQNDKRNILINDRFNYDVLNHTDLSRYSGYSGEINLETVNWSNYDLIVIDESHNFRNNNPRKDKLTRYCRLLNEVIKTGIKTKILMLSATPVNNKMNDLKNQVAFITEGNDSAFETEGIVSIEQTLRKAQLVFNKWQGLPDKQRTVDTFVEMMNMDYFKLLDTVTIARSRKHIEKYYNIQEIGKFPKREKPKNIYSDIDLKNEFPPLEKVNKDIKNLNMSVYSPLKYVLPEKREEYSKKYDIEVKGGKSVFRQSDREESLINLMRVNILKRMESSIYSFGMTIAKLLKEIDHLLHKIEKEYFGYNPNLNIMHIDFEDDSIEDLLIGNKVKVLLQDCDLIKWKQDLEDDKEKLEKLLIESAKVTNNRDAKLEHLKKLITEKIQNPINTNNKKVIVFTAFADTGNYLYENIAQWAKNKFQIYTALVTGSGSNKTNFKNIKKKDLNAILTNFSPKSKERDKIYPSIKEDIDILIATDCISEGQNLQDCDYLINYDIHWNPVRIIQRFGRIDRLGSTNDKIQLVNFWPNMELDEYINLEARVTGRMVLLDVSATGEENIIEFDEKKKMNDLEYRKKQLEQLQEEVVDLEEISGGISITDMTMNDFKMDLMEYMKHKRDKLEKAPMGMYAISKINDNSLKDTIKPGVIFTLKQVNEFAKTDDNNSLYPYYMVYVYEDGSVKFSYLHIKKILDFYKKLCLGKNEVIYDLVEAFNKETKDGKDMSKYSNMLDHAIRNIIGKKEQKGVASLFTKGGTTLQKSLFNGIEDFELISFLIIK
ncbi:helicase-related protein [Clostridium cochlearium]|uniref:helicase-related protein n=1 Tax=Clostridium cochlearium TaxID=1494 RepID=UPI00156FD2DC|nr:SNF2-related protein [Clostridium cochlearium]NSJ90926.1 DEAD/DEAH box helicase family protein [Coprococcus sp. MSK.21.13]